MVPEVREGGRERGIVPPPRDPARHVHDAQRPQRLAEGEGRAVELTEELVPLQEILAPPAGLFGVAARGGPEVLNGWADEAVVEVGEKRGGGGPGHFAPGQVAGGG